MALLMLLALLLVLDLVAWRLGYDSRDGHDWRSWHPCRPCRHTTSNGRDGACEEARRWVRRELSNLTGVLAAGSDLDGARAQLERAIEITEAILGHNDPNVAIIRRNLDRILHQVGDK
jgi:hypothetical protein